MIEFPGGKSIKPVPTIIFKLQQSSAGYIYTFVFPYFPVIVLLKSIINKSPSFVGILVRPGALVMVSFFRGCQNATQTSIKTGSPFYRWRSRSET